VEASTLQAPAGLARHRIAIGTPLLRLRSDEQLVALFRAGHDEAFRVIHDRYEKRLLAYTRQMLPRGQDAEDALQDVFVRAYSGLRSSNRELALRAWLFRVAHNRCIDELRRPMPPAPEVLQLTGRTIHDPVAEAEGRESLRRLIVDVRRLPDQQRSALLMREMGGMSYNELACTLDTSVPAVKSLLVRARIALAQAAEARDTACSDIREELVGAHDRGVRPNATAKRHMRDCAGCRSFRRELRLVNRRLAALAPLGPIALLAKALGISGGAGSGATATSGATAGGGVVAAGGAASGGGVLASGAFVVGSGHVATLLAAAVATAGGAVVISAPQAQPKRAPHVVVANTAAAMGTSASASSAQALDNQEAAVVAVGVSLLAQSKEAAVAAVSQATAPTKPKHKPAQRSSRPLAPPDEAAMNSNNTATPVPHTTPASSTPPVSPPVASGTTTSGATPPAETTTTPASIGADSTTDPGAGVTSTTSGTAATNGSTSTGSNTGSQTGGTTNTTNGGGTNGTGTTGTTTGTGSGSSGTTTGTSSTTGTSQSGSTTSSSSK
jgi:RNA polymerase sigma factor (sigma-70 family)